VITRGEWDEHYGADPDSAGALYEFRPASLGSEGSEYQWPLVEPNPPGWILIDRKPKVADNRISRLVQYVPLHGVGVGLVQNKPEVIKVDNPAKRLGYSLEEAPQVRSAGE